MTTEADRAQKPEPLAAAVGTSTEVPVQGLTCPNCGGSMDAHSGLRVVKCMYCKTPLLVVSEVGSRKLAVQPQLDSSAARREARGWLSRGWNRDRRLRSEARLGDALLCFLPFYRVEADCIGIALGTEQRTRTVGSGKRRRTETYEVDVERTMQRSFDLTYPALNVSEWGVQKIQLHGDILVAYDMTSLERLGMVFPPSGSESSVRAAALERIRLDADPGRDLYRLRFKFVETLRERLSVVYYPLWLVQYVFRGRSYQILIDAEDGSLSYGKAPGNDLYRALMLVCSQAAVLFVATTALQIAGNGPLLLVVGGLAMIGLRWGWRRFRHGGVVIEGNGVEPSPGLAAKIGAVGRRSLLSHFRQYAFRRSSKIQS